MLTIERHLHESTKPNSPHKTPTPNALMTPKKITTIAELRNKARERNRKRTKEYQQREAQRIRERFEFVHIMVELCERLAIAFNLDNALTFESLYQLFSSHNWYADGVFFSEARPLSLRFLKRLSWGGQLEIGNVVPCYNGLLPGEWHISRQRPNFRPHPEVVLMGSLTA